jgi:hypothetical protein
LSASALELLPTYISYCGKNGYFIFCGNTLNPKVSLKNFYIAIALLVVLLPLLSDAQLTNGGTNAYFGIDGDTHNNYVKYGTSSGNLASDDWFSSSSLLNGVIDTSNASTYAGLLSGNVNLGFNKRMSVPLFSKINGRLWLDAVYGRDYVATSPLFDSTIFTIASKNGDDPTNWLGGVSNIPDKNDLVDVYAHMRRDGLNIHDSLWLFTGVSTVGTSGSRYFDIELYKKDFSYSKSGGTFSTAGTEAGHTEWVFDASGNVTQTGDMIIAVNFTPGSAPAVDLRIWVSQTTYATVTPTYFKFGPNFDGATAAYGYASILSKSGGTDFGSGISNFSASPANDTTFATPWGTEQSTKNWGTQYQTLQLVETGLNLTRIGLDPALYTANGLNPCVSMFSDIFFKSRSSNSFVSNMQDFVEPLTFLRDPVMDFSLTPDTLRCNRPAGDIQITNNSTAGIYSWTTTNGNITGANSDSSQINLNKAGTYIVSASPALGCPATRTQTIVIPLDTFPPVASVFAGVGSNFSYLQLYGGDVSASNYLTPFGGSQGLLWDWSGPNSFTSGIQNPLTDTAWGPYQLIVTEKRNGCKDTATMTLNYFQFAVLFGASLTLEGTIKPDGVELTWLDGNQPNTDFYEIEKATGSQNFISIGKIINPVDMAILSRSPFYFNDQYPVTGSNYYRIKSVSKKGEFTYSNIYLANYNPNGQPKFYIASNSNGNPEKLVGTLEKDNPNSQGTLVIYSEMGQIVKKKIVQLSPGTNTIDIPKNSLPKFSVGIVSLYIGNQLAFSQKAFF